MLVDVVELRCRGEKRPRDEVRASTPIRAQLLLTKKWPTQDHDRATVFAALSGLTLGELDDARVLYIRGRNIVITGRQQVAAGEVYSQAWWCKIV